MKATVSLRMWISAVLLAVMTLGNQTVGSADAETAVETVQTNQMADDEIIAPIAGTLPEGVDPASAYAQLIRMVQAGVDERVMLAYIQKSPRFFELDGDDIIYLTNLGTPAGIIEAAIKRDEQLIDEGIGISNTERMEPSSQPQVEPTEDVTADEFYGTLAPYGQWVYVEGYGRCWRPTVVIYDDTWRPYCNNGYWVYSDHGWYWHSNYTWGWATFHYGRWFHHARYGWCWWPDTVWAPSWVYWRYNSDYCGWAPLPPRTVYRSGIGLVYRGDRVRVGVNIGLNESHFTFISMRYVFDPKPWRHCISRNEVRRVYGRTREHHDFAFRQEDRTVINRGIPLEQIPQETRRNVRTVQVRRDDGRRSREYDAQRQSVQTRTSNAFGRTDARVARGDSDTARGREAGSERPSALRRQRSDNGMNRTRDRDAPGRSEEFRANRPRSDHAETPRRQQRPSTPATPNASRPSRRANDDRPVDRPQARPRREAPEQARRSPDDQQRLHPGATRRQAPASRTNRREAAPSQSNDDTTVQQQRPQRNARPARPAHSVRPAPRGRANQPAVRGRSEEAGPGARGRGR